MGTLFLKNTSIVTHLIIKTRLIAGLGSPGRNCVLGSLEKKD